jgi:hypothetical protein
MTLAVSGNTDEDYALLIKAVCNEMIAEYPEVFSEAYLFNSKTRVKEHLRKSMKEGTWAETIDIFSCATVLQCIIVTYSIKSQKWMKVKPRAKCPETV